MANHPTHKTTIARMAAIHPPKNAFLRQMLECYNELSPEAQADIDAMTCDLADKLKNFGPLSGLELIGRLLMFEDETGVKLL